MVRSKPLPGTARVVDAATLKAFGHPLRMRLYDHLRDHGPATASVLARAMGESSGQTSYHLRQLERNGLVAEDVHRGTQRERWWRAEGFSFGAEALDDDDARSASEVVQRHQVASRATAQDAWISRQRTEEPAWTEVANTYESTRSLTPGELHELNLALYEVLDSHLSAARARREQEGEEGCRRVKVYLQSFPLPADEQEDGA